MNICFLKEIKIQMENKSVPEFRICIIGPSGVGKTSMVRRIQEDEFISGYCPTIGLYRTPITVNVRSSRYIGPVTLDIWDYSGLYHPKDRGELHYYGADAAILFFSLDDWETLAKAEKYREEFIEETIDKPVFVVGAKADIRANSTFTIPGWAKDYIVHSSKAKINNCTVFISVIRKLLNIQDNEATNIVFPTKKSKIGVIKASEITKLEFIYEHTPDQFEENSLIFLCGKFGIVFDDGMMLKAINMWIAKETAEGEEKDTLVDELDTLLKEEKVSVSRVREFIN